MGCAACHPCSRSLRIPGAQARRRTPADVPRANESRQVGRNVPGGSGVAAMWQTGPGGLRRGMTTRTATAKNQATGPSTAATGAAPAARGPERRQPEPGVGRRQPRPLPAGPRPPPAARPRRPDRTGQAGRRRRRRRPPGDGGRQPPPRRPLGPSLPGPRRRPARPDPGGHLRPDAGRRQVRLGAGLPLLHVRHLVDPSGPPAGRPAARPHHPAPDGGGRAQPAGGRGHVGAHPPAAAPADRRRARRRHQHHGAHARGPDPGRPGGGQPRPAGGRPTRPPPSATWCRPTSPTSRTTSRPS